MGQFTKKLLENGITFRQILRDHGYSVNRESKIICPYHYDRNPSFSINDDNESGHCYSCGEHADIFRFVKDNIVKTNSESEAMSYLEDKYNLPKEYQAKTTHKVVYLNDDEHKNRLKTFLLTKGINPLEIYVFRHSNIHNTNQIYFKIKYFDKKENRKIVNFCGCELIEGEYKYFMTLTDSTGKRTEQIPYTSKKLSVLLEEARSHQKKLVITEGEKDCHTIEKYLNANSISFKGIKLDNFDWQLFNGIDVYFCGDTGEAGEKYKDDIWKRLQNIVNKFFVLDLQGIDELGNNKDITDWIECNGSDINPDLILKSNNCYKYLPNKKETKFYKSYSVSKDDIIIPKVTVSNIVGLFKRYNIVFQYNKNLDRYLRTASTIQFLDKNNCLSIPAIADFLISHSFDIKYLKNEIIISAVIKNREEFNEFENICEKNINNDIGLVDSFIKSLNLKQEGEEKMFKRFLYQIVESGCDVFRGRNPNLVTQYALVLYGEQGSGKSSLASFLGMNNNSIFQTSSLDLDDAHSKRQATSRTVVELAENIVMGRKSVEAFKNFITQSQDSWRILYTQTEQFRSRYTSFIITTNEKKSLTDSTGSRRFLVIEPHVNKDKNGIPNFEFDMKAIYGAIFKHLLDMTEDEKNTFYYSLTDIVTIQQRNSEFYDGGNVGLILEEIFDFNQQWAEKGKFTYLKPKDLWDNYLIPNGLSKDKHIKQVYNFLSNKGVKLHDKNNQTPQYKINNKNIRCYKLPQLIDEIDDCFDVEKKEIVEEPTIAPEKKKEAIVVNDNNIKEYMLNVESATLLHDLSNDSLQIRISYKDRKSEEFEIHTFLSKQRTNCYFFNDTKTFGYYVSIKDNRVDVIEMDAILSSIKKLEAEKRGTLFINYNGYLDELVKYFNSVKGNKFYIDY